MSNEALVDRRDIALAHIARMRLFPDDKTNTITLLAAIRLAKAAIERTDEPDDKP